MKILITGGGSVFAKNLVETLHDSYDIYAPTRQELDLLDAQKVQTHLKESKYDVVIHTATYDAAPIDSKKDPAKVLENNTKMYFHLARNSDHFGKMLYYGSGAEFSRPFWKSKMREDYFDQHVPTDQYGLSKYIMTQHALKSSNIYNLRVFGVFGKYEDWRYRVISNFCAKAVLGLPLTINDDKAFDFLSVDDLVRVTEYFIKQQPKHHVYNICTGNEYKFSQLASIMASQSSQTVEVRVKQDSPLCYSGDNSLFLAQYPEFKFTPIEESIAKLYQWYWQNKEEIKEEEFHY